MSRNLGNNALNNGNAISIGGIPVSLGGITNGEVLGFSGGQIVPLMAGSGSIDAVTNVGTGSGWWRDTTIISGVSTANFKSVLNTDGNIIITPTANSITMNLGSSIGLNIYNSDGTLTANRTLTMAGKTFSFGTFGETAALSIHSPVVSESNWSLTGITKVTNVQAVTPGGIIQTSAQLSCIADVTNQDAYMTLQGYGSFNNLGYYMNDPSGNGWAFEYQTSATDLNISAIGSNATSNGRIILNPGTGAGGIVLIPTTGLTVAVGGTSVMQLKIGAKLIDWGNNFGSSTFQYLQPDPVNSRVTWQNLANDSLTTTTNLWSASQTQSAINSATGVSSIYTADGTLAGPRTVTQSSNKLSFSGGPIQLNNTAVTTQSTSQVPFAVMSDSSGNLSSYSATYTNNSLRFPVAIQNLTTLSNNCMDVYTCTQPSNACFHISAFLSMEGSFDSWMAEYQFMGKNSSDTGWLTIPMIQSGVVSGGNAYIMQGRIGQFNNQQLQLRIVKVVNNSISAGVPATLTIVRYDSDSSSSTYSLPTQTPYNGIFSWTTPLQGLTKTYTYNVIGNDISTIPSLTFNYYPGMNLLLSLNFGVRITGTGNYTITFQFNSSYNHPQTMPTNSSAVANLNCCPTIHGFDLGAMQMLQSGFVSAGTNTLTCVISQSGLSSAVTAGQFYCLTLYSTY
jgi:hypothetical protein